MFVIAATIESRKMFMCKDRKWRSNPLSGDFKECLQTFKKPNNATTKVKRLVLRNPQCDAKVIPADEAYNHMANNPY